MRYILKIDTDLDRESDRANLKSKGFIENAIVLLFQRDCKAGVYRGGVKIWQNWERYLIDSKMGGGVRRWGMERKGVVIGEKGGGEGEGEGNLENLHYYWNQIGD